MERINYPTDLPRAVHSWLRKINVTFYPGPYDPVLEEVIHHLKIEFNKDGHTILDAPRGNVDVIITTALYNQPVPWRESLMFTARRRFNLDRIPTTFTLIHIRKDELDSILAHFKLVLGKDNIDPADYNFPGLAPNAYLTLHEQGHRAGPILSLVRLLQSQSMCIRIILVIGEDHPEAAYTFDLVGAYPKTDASDREPFYEDLALRVITAVSTNEVTAHEVIGEPISLATWQSLTTPAAMRRAGEELGKREFFTKMIDVSMLVHVPLFNDALAKQYSEGCFATWEPDLDALIATITGSARPVEKDRLSDDEMAIISSIRPDNSGARVRLVEGKKNDPPSSEAVELIGMDDRLPHILLGSKWGFSQPKDVPVGRSKLHGHRGVRAFDPTFIEHVFLDPAYYHYPVSCSTDAQAMAIMNAFGRSEALNNPQDPRQLIFTILPGHGMVVVEKWVTGKVPFQVIWEAMDSGRLQIDSRVPQGPISFVSAGPDRVILQEIASSLE